MFGLKIYRDILIKTTVTIIAFLLWVSTVTAVDNTALQEDYLKQLKDAQKREVSIEIRANNVFSKAVSNIIISKGGADSKNILSRARDTRHKAVILKAEGKYVKALERITESTDLLAMAVNKVEDGIAMIKDRELQQKMEVRLNEAFTRLRDRMATPLIQHEVFQTAALKVLERKRDKEASDLMEDGKYLKEKAVITMIDEGDYEKFNEYIKESTNNFITIVNTAGEEREEGDIIFEQVGIVIQANKSLINAASTSFTGTDDEGVSGLFKNALRFRKNAVLLHSKGDYEKAIEELKKSNDFAIKVIRLSVEVEDVQP